eukprot:scaffold11716_cov112-Isochrysis_galbana.AAC.2
MSVPPLLVPSVSQYWVCIFCTFRHSLRAFIDPFSLPALRSAGQHHHLAGSAEAAGAAGPAAPVHGPRGVPRGAPAASSGRLPSKGQDAGHGRCRYRAAPHGRAGAAQTKKPIG